VEILPGIHRIEAPLGDRYVALYLVIGDDCALLVDTGVEDSVRVHLREYLRLKGIPAERLRYALNTHADFDHIGGNGPLKELNPEVLLTCGEYDRRLIEDVEALITDRYGEFQHQHGFDETDETKAFIRTVTQVSSIDIGLQGGETFDLGNRRVEILHVPGHSPGHLAVFDPLTNSVMVGDAVLADSVLTAKGEPAFPPTYRDVDSYRATVRTLLALQPDALLTAHYAAAYGPDVIEFLTTTLNYCDIVERVVEETVTTSDEPLTLLEIINRAAHRVGPWPTPARDYLVYPVLGHLEFLEKLHRVSRIEGRHTGDMTRWTGGKAA
jgi:glyoxylase-like metal-dependent hydrolase (beta-lactamase superfamily II)